MIRLLGVGLMQPPAIRLDGERVYLRSPRGRDWQAWADLRGESRAFLEPWEPTWPADALTRAAFARRLRRAAQEWRDDLGYGFLTFELATDRLVGGITISNVRRGVAQMGTVGYWAGERFTRRGFTSEACRLVLGFAFGQLGLHRMEAACLPNNEASITLLERVGFRREGHARGYLRIDGAWRDHLLYGITREEWPR
ncbi:MAG TPA: GNAT family protein [Azospirillaceae bacterium]|nr:GNAT family protein [Azospirillaceae bacterium]